MSCDGDRDRTDAAGHGAGGRPRPGAVQHRPPPAVRPAAGPGPGGLERGAWLLGGDPHADVSAVESRPRDLLRLEGILVDEIGITYPSPPTILHTDPPAHTRYRRLVQPGFKPTVVRALEPVVRARAKALVDGHRRRADRRRVRPWPCRCPCSSSVRSWVCPRRNGSAATSGPRRSCRGPPTGPRSGASSWAR